MAKLFKHLLGKKSPPEPPEPDYDAKNGRRSRSWDYESDEEALPEYISADGRLSTTLSGVIPIIHSSSPPKYLQKDRDFHTASPKPRPHSYVGSTGVEQRANVDTRSKESDQTPARKTVIVEDYSDPFDLRKPEVESIAAPLYETPPDGPISGKAYEEDDYSEPYEARKIVQQSREGTKQKAMQKGERDEKSHGTKKVHVYEDPYDPDIAKQPTTADLVEQQIESQDQKKRDYSRQIEDGSYDEHSKEQARYSQCHELDDRPADEYDEPWDWRNKNRLPKAILDKRAEIVLTGKNKPEQVEYSETMNEDSNSACGACGISQQTREKDLRPVDEYEIPWDWKPKDRLSQALLDELGSSKHSSEQPSKKLDFHQIDGIERAEQTQLSQSPNTVDAVKSSDNPQQSPKRSALKLDIKPKIETLGEVIDPTIPLEEQRWYHGKLSRQDAELVLRMCEECSYLVRQSESGSAKDYSLSLKSTRGFMHMKIVKHEEGYILGEFSKPFATIPAMIDHYSRNKLNIKGAEHMALLHPITSQLL